MTRFLGNYSNGWGHLIVTVVAIICMTVLLVFSKIDVAFFAAVITPVLAVWAVPAIANKTIEVAAKIAPDIISPVDRPIHEPQPIILQEPPKQNDV